MRVRRSAGGAGVREWRARPASSQWSREWVAGGRGWKAQWAWGQGAPESSQRERVSISLAGRGLPGGMALMPGAPPRRAVRRMAAVGWPDLPPVRKPDSVSRRRPPMAFWAWQAPQRAVRIRRASSASGEARVMTAERKKKRACRKAI